MTRASFLVLLLAALVIPGCATSPPDPAYGGDARQLPRSFTVYFPSPAPTHRSYVPAPVERVAELVPEAYELMGFAAARATSTDTVIFITPNLRLRGPLYQGERNSVYINCGTGTQGNKADHYEIHFAIFSRLSEGESEGETVVETALGGRAYGPVSSGAVTCRGTGRLEAEIARILQSRARG